MEELRTRSKVVVWTGVTLSYLFTFLAPILSAYFLLAKDKTAHKGGFLYFSIVLIFGIGAIVALRKLIKKQDANLFKTIFRWIIKMIILVAFMLLFKYIDYNLEALSMVLYTVVGSFFIAFLIESYLVLNYRDYVRKIGVFGGQ